MIVTDTSLQLRMRELQGVLATPEGRLRVVEALGPRLIRSRCVVGLGFGDQVTELRAYDDQGQLVDVGTITRAKPAPQHLDTYVCHYCGTEQLREPHEPGTRTCHICGGNRLHLVAPPLPPPPPPVRRVPAPPKRRWWQLDIYPFTPDRKTRTNSGGPS